LQLSRAVLTPDASFLAAAVTMVEEKTKKPKEIIAVWEVVSGKLLAALASDAISLTVSPDGKLVAAGDSRGEITVWSLPDGKVQANLWASPAPIRCLAFGHDVRRDRTERAKFAGLTGWLLAAGSQGEGVKVWDLAAGIPRTYCHGSHHDIYTVAF